MKIDVSEFFRKKVQKLPFDVTSQLSTIDRDELIISLNSPINIKGNAYYDEEEVVTLVGTITTTLKMQCSMCLEDVLYPVSIEFNEEYTKLNSDEDRYLISEEETIELLDMVTDNLILFMPIKANCTEDCKGLCPKCGKNLNKGLCNCTSDDIDPRLEVLKNLFKGE
ncbi:MAG: YceD family protein [Clostridium sp.]